MRFLRAARSVSVAVVLSAAAIGMSRAIASAAAPCSVNTDQCQVNNTVQTPAGLVSVTVGPGHVVTVRLTPVKPNTLVRAMPATFQPHPRTASDTAGRPSTPAARASSSSTPSYCRPARPRA